MLKASNYVEMFIFHPGLLCISISTILKLSFCIMNKTFGVEAKIFIHI